MDILVILLIVSVIYVANDMVRLQQLRQRVKLFTRDADMLLGERLKQVMMLEQTLRGFTAFPNPALVEALFDVTSYLLKQKKSLNERLTDEQRLSKLIASTREALAQPIMGAVFGQRDAMNAAMLEIDELESSVRALLTMVQGATKTYNQLFDAIPSKYVAPLLGYESLSLTDWRV
jgi:hypothetical protein